MRIMASGTKYTVEMDDGTTHVVTVDQRDWAQMEAQEFPARATMTATRYLVFNAMKREQQLKDTWEKFNTTSCVSVDLAPDESEESDEGEGEQGSHPGR
jgi:hypothetical protein